MDIFIQYFMPFILVLTRIAAFMFSCPVFGWRTIPVRVKLAIVVLLSIFFSFTVSPDVMLNRVPLIAALILIAQEAAYGLALGLICNCLFFAVRIAGRIAEVQMGLTMANIMDPLTGDTGQPMGTLLEMIFVLLFFSIEGHHIFIMLIAKSFDSFALGVIPTTEMLYSGVIQSCSTMMLLGLRLAAPMLAAFMVLMVVLAILARIAPEMNILFISLPVKVGLGLLMAAIFLPYINSYLKEFQVFVERLIPI